MTNKPKTDQQLAETFLKEYNALCKKHGSRIVTVPEFRARDDRTFSIILQTSVEKIPQVDS